MLFYGQSADCDLTQLKFVGHIITLRAEYFNAALKFSFMPLSGMNVLVQLVQRV